MKLRRNGALVGLSNFIFLRQGVVRQLRLPSKALVVIAPLQHLFFSISSRDYRHTPPRAAILALNALGAFNWSDPSLQI